MADSSGYTEQGVASWYGRECHGRRTSNGEIYDMYALTAAHKTRPLPAYARITNLENGRSVVVRINDRGPFKDNRIVDLSYWLRTNAGLSAADAKTLVQFLIIVGALMTGLFSEGKAGVIGRIEGQLRRGQLGTAGLFLVGAGSVLAFCPATAGLFFAVFWSPSPCGSRFRPCTSWPSAWGPGYP